MSAHAIEVPWGPTGTLGLRWPETWPAPEVFWPRRDGAVRDYEAALSHALDHPQDSPGLDGLVGPGKTVAIVVDDPSRWTPVRAALPLVLGRLQALGVREEDVTISVGVGRHQVVDDQAMRRRLGDAIVAGFACHSPPVDDLGAYDELGTSDDGLVVRVFRPVARADLRILIGSVLAHLQAGFGGGYKLVFPGCCHRSTLASLHRMGLGPGRDAGALLGGDASANPMRRAIHNAARLLPGPCLSISHVMGRPSEVLRVLAGHPETVQDHLADEVRERFRFLGGPLADVVVVGNDPWPGDPMQSFKVLLQHRRAARRGGVLVGLFWTDPDEIARSMPLGWSRAIASSGLAGHLIIRHGLKAADSVTSALDMRSAFMVRWARELLVDQQVLVYSPELRARVGARLGPVRLFEEQGPLWEAVRERLPRTSLPVARVFPLGGLTYYPG